jgi:hypothetical protein
MAILVRSSQGNVDTNQTTIQVDSPATIVAGDLLFIPLLVNDDSPAGAITPPSGFVQRSDYTDASTRTRAMAFTKTADATDVTNAGTADYYDFSGFNSTDDVIHACLALYNSAGGTPFYTGDVRWESGSGGSSQNTGNTIVRYDASLVINCFSAHGGSDYFNIDASNSITNGGRVDTKLNTAWTNDAFSDSKQVVYSHEVDIADSVFSPTLNFSTITADGRGEMAMSYMFDPQSPSHGIVNSTTRTSTTGTKDYIKAGLGTPKAAIVLSSYNSAQNTDINDFGMAAGLTDFTTEVLFGTNYEDNVSPTDARVAQNNDRIHEMSDPGTQTQDSVAAENGTVTDGMQLNFSAVHASTSRRLSAIMLKEGIDSVSVDYVTLNGAGTVTVTPGFQADILIAFGNGGTVEPGGNGFQSALGFYHRADDVHRIMGWRGDDGQTTPTVGCGVDSDFLIGTCNNGATSFFDTFQAENFTSTQYDITNISGSASPQVGIMAIKLAAGYEAKVGYFNAPVTSGVTSVITGLSFQPQFAMFAASSFGVDTADEVSNTGCEWSIGACDADAEVAVGMFAEDRTSASNSNCQGWHREDACIYLKGIVAAVRVQATFDSFQSDGVDLDFTTATASWDNTVNYLVIGLTPGVVEATLTTGLTMAADLDAAGSLASNPTISYSESAAISTAGPLAASIPISYSSAAGMSATGKLEVSATMSFGMTAVFIDTPIIQPGLPIFIPSTRSIDAKTVAESFNRGQPREPDYTWPNRRKFYQ